MNRLETILKAIVLGGLGLMFYTKISDGTLTFYINQRFAWLSFVAVLLLAALAMTLVYRLIEQRRATPARPHEHAVEPEVDHHEHAHAHEGHDHGNFTEAAHSHTHGLSWGSVAILAIPLVLGLAVPARPLGASAISNRGIGLSAPDRPGSVTVAQRAATGPKNVLDWLREFARDADPAAFTGQAVDVTGFVYRDPRNGANEFWVSRFTISCCVADASAIGLLVQTDQAGELKNDKWVRVTGKLGVGEFAGEKIPVIVPDKVEPVGQPENPYLYP
jgi:putative membrane protein